MKRRAQVGLVALAVLLSGCAHLDPADRALRSDPVARIRPVGPSPWRLDFGDSALAGLLRDADLGALDVKIALARLARARADLAMAQAGRAPRVSIGADAAGGGATFHDARSGASPTLEAVYEIDLWGRLARAEDAATQDQAAADADVTAARLIVAADTVRAFAALRSAQDGVEGGVRRTALAGRGLVLTERRAAEGGAKPQAVESARQTLAQAQIGLATSREEVTLQTAQLADLLGRPALAVPPGPFLASEPNVPPPGSEIIDARPDVRAALSRLRAADARRAESVAASRPQFRVAALFGASDAAIAALLDVRTLAWALGASLSHAVVDGGAARARVHAASADADTADLQYRKTVLAAWSEVRAALIDTARARRDLAAAQAADTLAQDGLHQAETRHREGAADGLDLVDANVASETAQDGLRTARLAAVEARVRLALATGGL